MCRCRPTTSFLCPAAPAKRPRDAHSKRQSRRERAWPSGAFPSRHPETKARTMKSSDLPIEPSVKSIAQTAQSVELRHSRAHTADCDGVRSVTPNYFSLLDYSRLLWRYKLTLVSFAAASIAAALLISLMQTPIYRVRTSLEIQSASATELKNPDSAAAAAYASPESYVE